jgi:hypothetical protein
VLSFEAQQMAFFTTFVISYISLYEIGARIWHLLLLITLFAIVFLGDHVLNYHRANAIVCAALLGVMLATIYQWLLYMIVVPTFPLVLRNPYMLYLAYEDTMCYTSKTSALGRYVIVEFDKRFAEEPVTRAAVCELVRGKAIEYLTKEHPIFLPNDIDRMFPRFEKKLECVADPLTKYNARQFIEENF